MTTRLFCTSLVSSTPQQSTIEVSSSQVPATPPRRSSLLPPPSRHSELDSEGKGQAPAPAPALQLPSSSSRAPACAPYRASSYSICYFSLLFSFVVPCACFCAQGWLAVHRSLGTLGFLSSQIGRRPRPGQTRPVKDVRTSWTRSN